MKRALDAVAKALVSVLFGGIVVVSTVAILACAMAVVALPLLACIYLLVQML